MMSLATASTFLRDYGADIARLTGKHLALTFLAVLIAAMIAIPLGVALARCRWRTLRDFTLGFINIFQPIPSLALVALVGAAFIALGLPSIGLAPGLVALVVYALLPIARNTYTGIHQVDPAVIEVATGMGMTGRQILFKVQLPLALPFIMAGMRIATVWTIGVATLVSLVGAPSLGDLIFRGLSRSRLSLILAGAIPAIVLALGFDWLLGRIERHLSTAGRDEAPGGRP